MSRDTARAELLSLLDGANAHMTPDEVLADFPMDKLNAKPPNCPYSCWHILEHMRIALWDIVEFVRNPDHVSPAYPDGYRPRPSQEVGPADWERSVTQFKKDLADLRALAADPATDLLAPIPHAPDYTLFREVLTAADHNAYHCGELAMMRQVLGLWPEGEEYLTGY